MLRFFIEAGTIFLSIFLFRIEVTDFVNLKLNTKHNFYRSTSKHLKT